MSAVVAISIVAALGMSAGLLGAQPDLTDQFIADGSQDAPGSWSLPDGILSMGTPQYAFAQNPDSTPPTFVSSGLDSTTGVLTITFSETIDVTPATNVVPTKIHIRESGNYTGGTTLSAGELGTTADGTTISFTLTASNNATVAGLTTPELTIEPGAVRDTSSNLIDGTFDVFTAAFVSVTSIVSQEAIPTGMAFSNDGLKMFVVGRGQNNINEYTLTAAFDASTASYAGDAERFSVSSQEAQSQGMAFSNDGLKMFVVGNQGDGIDTYNLTAAFDASTSTHAHFFNGSSQQTAPNGMAFSNDGFKMFVVGSGGGGNTEDEINEYTLSAAFDVSTATFVDDFSVTLQDAIPQGMAFSNDGLKMFVVDSSNHHVSEYTLSTAFDVSTASYSGDTERFSVSQDEFPTDMTFSNDGTKMFVIGGQNDSIYEYTLSSVYSITVTTTINNAPVAEAGPNLQVNEGGFVTLQGSGSDDDNDSLTYSWSSDPRISFNDQNSATPTVTASSVTADTQITLTLTVSDGTASHTDTMVLTIRNVNNAPVAEAGPNLQVNEGGFVTLQGSGSDDDNDSLTYSWSSDPRISFNDQNSATPTVTASSVTADTQITLTLTVSDGTASHTDTMVLTIRNVNNAPVAEAGPNLQVNEGGFVTLQGSGSDDDNDSLTYSWSSDPRISFNDQNSATPTVTASSVTADTQITLTLTVSDGTASHTDTMVLTILDVTAGNLRPTVSVGPDQTVKEMESVSMPWTAVDPDGDALTYSWSQNPALPQIPLNSPNSSPTTFTAPLVTNNTAFTFTLTVTAGTHMTEDSLTITVKNNRPPAVDAGSDRTVNERTAVTLSGSASDPDGDTLTYAWTHDSGPSVDLTGTDTVRPQFMAPGVTSDGTIVLRFTATDGGESVGDTVAITVRDVPITVSSATYNPGSGTITITFNQDINGTPDYSKLHVRGSGSDSGGIALSDVDDKSYLDRTITATLSSGQQEQYDALQGQQLGVEADAVTDAEDVGIEEMLDVTIRGTSSGKRSSTPPPAVDLNALASRGVDIPKNITEAASGHGSDPIPPVAPDGTFDFPLVINGQGYLLDGPTNTLVPHAVAAGQPVTISVSIHDQTPIAYFAMYLNLQGDHISHLQSDTQVIWDSGQVRIIDPNGLIRNATVTISVDPDDPTKKTVTLTASFSEGMGVTNMVIRTWNAGGQITTVQIFDALDVRAPEPEPAMVDPETSAEQNAVDPEPAAMLDAVDPGTAGQDSADSPLLAIRMWSGFEPESITDAQLLASLGLDYPGIDIPNWVMTELGVLVSNGEITVEQFKTALEYVLEHS